MPERGTTRGSHPSSDSGNKHDMNDMNDMSDMSDMNDRGQPGQPAPSRAAADCVLCREDGGRVLWRDATLRVIDAGDTHYPGFTRVIWNSHAAEMSDLDGAAQQALMATVLTVERVQREVLRPDKVNLASLGNMVAHVHWHVIPRWRDDAHFPDAVWAAPRRQPLAPSAHAPAGEALQRYHQALVEALQAAATR